MCLIGLPFLALIILISAILSSRLKIIELKEDFLIINNTKRINVSKQYYGDYNNLLIYDFKNQNVEKLFTQRINFRNIRTEYFKDDILVVIEATTDDTYKDGVVNQLDYKTLFIYSLSGKRLKEVKLENADVSQVNFVENNKDLIIKFGIDHNNDGKFDPYSEPSLIKKYDYNTGKLIDIVSENINNELQMNLEGTKK